tara:strand:+ start:96 stop:305 length:210 start_codon:yes stop_codon:yes gene_type:complete
MCAVVTDTAFGKQIGVLEIKLHVIGATGYQINAISLQNLKLGCFQIFLECRLSNSECYSFKESGYENSI